MIAQTVGAEEPSVSVSSRRDRWPELGEAFDTERRLLGELIRILLHQREGLSGNDVEILDDSVYSAQRVLLTLHEARRRRQSLLKLLLPGEAVNLSSLRDELVGAPAATLEALDRLLDAAQALRRELGINRTAIQGAASIGDGLIRALTRSAGRATSYARHTDGSPAAPSGVLLDRQG